MVELTLKDTMTNEYYKCKVENSSTKIGGFILHQKKNGEYRSCELVKIKEVKKVNKIPYFELKVVKVKKEKEDGILSILKRGNCDWKDNGKELTLTIHKGKPKGNWVNGENLDKIKFPCFCSYRSHTGKKHYAQINKNRNSGIDAYEMSRLFQDDCESIFLSSNLLKKLIRKWDIHILKGKIIIFEEEEK